VGRGLSEGHDLRRVPLALAAELDLAALERDPPARLASGAQARGGGSEPAQGLSRGLGHAGDLVSIQEGGGALIGQASVVADQAQAGVGRGHHAVWIDPELHGHGGPVHVGQEAQAILAQAARDHGEHTVWEVDRRPSGPCRDVQRGPFGHGRVDVGDRDQDSDRAVGLWRKDGEGVVEVLGAGAIYGQRRDLAQVSAPFACVVRQRQGCLFELWGEALLDPPAGQGPLHEVAIGVDDSLEVRSLASDRGQDRSPGVELLGGAAQRPLAVSDGLVDGQHVLALARLEGAEEDPAPATLEPEIGRGRALLVGLEPSRDEVPGQEASQGRRGDEGALVLAEVEEAEAPRVQGESASDAIAQGSPRGWE